MLFSILIAVMVILGIVLIVLILLQQGKGADAGAAFGSGASGTVFGARGSSPFLSRTTGILMALFMILAIVMVYISQRQPAQSGSVMASAAAAPAAASAKAAIPSQPRLPAAAGKRSPTTAKTPAPVPKTGGKG